MPDTAGAMTTAGAVSIFKQLFAPRIAELVPQKAIAYKLFSKSTEKVQNNFQYLQPFRKRANQTAGIAIASSAALPQAQANTFDQFQITAKKLVGMYSLEGDYLRTAKKGQGAWIDGLSYEADSLEQAFIKHLNVYLFGHGTGVIGVTSGTTAQAATSIELKRQGYLSTARFAQGAKHFQEGDFIVVHNGTGASIRGTATVTGVYDEPNSGAPYITVDAIPAGTVAGDFIYLGVKGQATATTKDATPQGLNGIIDDGTTVATYFNITRSTTPVAQGNVNANAGTLRALTHSLMLNVNKKIRRNSGGTGENGLFGADCLLMSDAMQIEYFDMLEGSVRFAPQEFKGGFLTDKMNFGYGEKAIPILTDIDCPEFTIYFLNKPSLKYYEVYPLKVLDEDGLDIRASATYDSYEGRMGMMINFASVSPRDNAILTDLTTQNVATQA